jgi:exopolysaccharide biosynthesis predicted pyruvyltransferase EpsI
MSPRNEPVIAAQSARLDELYRAHVQPGVPYCLLDFPDHSNVGDSAIYAGELCLLDAHAGRPATYVCTFANFDRQAFQRACPTGLVLIHGGGNFGDIWPAHQRFREMIIAEFRDRKIIQLPQSIHFQEKANLDHCAKVIASHPDFHLWVRDAKSGAFAREHFDCTVELAPDSAFALGPLVRRGRAQVETLALLRTDVEQKDFRTAALDREGLRLVDWLEEDPLGRARRAATQLRALLAGRVSGPARDEFKYRQLATIRVERGLRLLSEGRGLVTDRLHAHILATLLDIPHVALDNTYGKIASYVSAWTADYRAVRLATSLEGALAELERLQASMDVS